MSKFLFTTLPSNDLGLLTRSLPIARELQKSGHEIFFSSPAKAPRILIRTAGFVNLVPKHPLYQISGLRLRNFLPFKGQRLEYGGIFRFLYRLIRDMPKKFAPSTPEIWDMNHAAAMAGLLNENFVAANCRAYLDLIKELNPDVIVDFWNPFACIAARVLKKTLVTVIQADGHPGNKGLIWWKERPENLPSALPIVNKVITGYGLDPLNRMEDLNLGDLTLVVGTPETDPVPKDSRCFHIGAVLWEKSGDTLPDWIENFSRNKPLIWVYPGNPRYRKKGTLLDSEVIIRAAKSVLAGMGVQVILTTGTHMLPPELLPLPDNFFFADFLPGLKLAEKCDLIIHHGGYGSCQTGLYAGTPSLIIPTFSERESNARRIAGLGAGEFVLPRTGKARRKEIDLDDFREKLEKVLSTPSYRMNSRRQSEKLKLLRGARKAAQLIEDFLER